MRIPRQEHVETRANLQVPEQEAELMARYLGSPARRLGTRERATVAIGKVLPAEGVGRKAVGGFFLAGILLGGAIMGGIGPLFLSRRRRREGS